MHTTEYLCPSDFTGVLALEEKGFIFAAVESENLQPHSVEIDQEFSVVNLMHLAVSTDKKSASAGINFVTREGVNFDLLHSGEHSENRNRFIAITLTICYSKRKSKKQVSSKVIFEIRDI